MESRWAVFRRPELGKLLEVGRERGQPGAQKQARKALMPLSPAGYRGPKCAVKHMCLGLPCFVFQTRSYLCLAGLELTT